MEIKLKGRNIPRNEQGDAHFEWLGPEQSANEFSTPCVLDVFTRPEVVELVNRALYQLEYQREAHKKRGHEQRAKEKALREALKKQGLDVKKSTIDKQLKGE